MSSILNDTKAKLGIGEDYTHFDTGNIIDHINTTFFVLNQLGVGPDTPFTIEDDTAEWEDFVPKGDVEAVKTYVFLKARLYFDPPQNGTHINSMNEMVKELECRMNYQVDPGGSNE